VFLLYYTWVTITTLVQDRQCHLTQGEAPPPHVEARETPNRDNNDLDVLSKMALHKVATKPGDRLSLQTR
jgi:hypothetical protein